MNFLLSRPKEDGGSAVFKFAPEKQSQNEDGGFSTISKGSGEDFNNQIKRIQEDSRMSPRSKKREANKLYCKNTRRKNKEYTKQLEARIDELEDKVANLTSMVEKYKFKLHMMSIGEDKDLRDFKVMEEIGRIELVGSLYNGTHSSHLKDKISELSKKSGSAGTDRQKLIKTAFKLIIENLVPDRMRILFNIVKEESSSTYEDYKRLYSMNRKKFEMEMQDPKYNEIDRFHYYTRVDPKLYNKMKILNEKNRYYHQKFQLLVHETVRLRNKILKVI